MATWLKELSAVSLELWPQTYVPEAEAFTSVSTWWGERDYVGAAENLGGGRFSRQIKFG